MKKKPVSTEHPSYSRLATATGFKFSKAARLTDFGHTATLEALMASQAKGAVLRAHCKAADNEFCGPFPQ